MKNAVTRGLYAILLGTLGSGCCSNEALDEYDVVVADAELLLGEPLTDESCDDLCEVLVQDEVMPDGDILHCEVTATTEGNASVACTRELPCR